MIAQLPDATCHETSARWRVAKAVRDRGARALLGDPAGNLLAEQAVNLGKLEQQQARVPATQVLVVESA
jgi:hypothetical protein